MVEIQNHATRLQHENDRLQTRLEADLGKNIHKRTHPAPPIQPSKGKEPILPGNSDPPADDELFSSSSSLLEFSPSQNNTEAKSRKRPLHHSSRSVSGMCRRIHKEVGRDRRHSEMAPESMLSQHGGMAPPVPFIYPTAGEPPSPHLVSFTTVWGPEDILSSPLGQHILSYELPCGFAIPPFDMYDDSSNPYDHMLHFNQVMILNAGNDHLMCMVFPASLKGFALAWFHKLPRGSINSFSELWAAFISEYLCSVK